MISFLQMSLWAAALTALICVVRTVFGRRLSKRTFRILWAVVILRMLVPFSLPVVKINTDITVPAAVDTALTQDTVVYTYIEGDFTQIGTTDRITPQTEYAYAVTENSAAGIWLLTAAAVFAVFAAVHLKFRLKVRDSIPAGINFDTGLKRRVRIKVSDRIDSPLTYGVFRPVVLLPKNIYECDEKTAAYILSHELIHIKRFDVLYKLFMVLAVSLHWFNPLAWVMLVFAGRDIELSCDEEVVLGKNGSGSEREEYAMTLIGMEERRSFGALHSGFGGSSVKERIRSVMRLKRSSTLEKAAASALVAMAFTVFTVYDIESGVSYSVAVSASESAEVSYTADFTAEENAYYSEYVIQSFADGQFITEGTDSALDSGDIAAENAAAPSVEAETAVGTYADSVITKMYLITTADGTVFREYPEDYSLYHFGYDDPKTGKVATVLIDVNEYSPVDYALYGLTASEDKGYFLYNGTPVGGFQSLDFTFVDGNAAQDGGIFLIYKDAYDIYLNEYGGSLDLWAGNDMVQVGAEQFCDITGARL